MFKHPIMRAVVGKHTKLCPIIGHFPQVFVLKILKLVLLWTEEQVDTFDRPSACSYRGFPLQSRRLESLHKIYASKCFGVYVHAYVC